MKYFFANWKTYLKEKEATGLAKKVLALGKTGKGKGGVLMAVFPSTVHLATVGKILKGKKVAVGAQDVGAVSYGAETGALSAREAKACGAKYVLVGHSERRQVGENNVLIARKFVSALEAGLVPVLCVGETEEERASGKALDVVLEQVESAVSAAGKLIGARGASTFLVAYEPVWAIGTGKAAEFTEVVEMHIVIRKQLAMIAGDFGATVPILYGGSVTEENVAEYVSLPAVDGVLVGRASADAKSLRNLCSSLGLFSR